MNEYEMIIEGMHFGVSKHLFDKHFTILWANDYAYGLTGYTKDEFYLKYRNRVDEYYRKDSETFDYMSSVIEGSWKKQKEGYLFECPVKPKRGKTVWLAMNGRFSGETYRGVPLIWNVFYDITDIRRSRKELEEKSELLISELQKVEQMKQWLTCFVSELNEDVHSMANIIGGLSDVAVLSLNDPKRCEACLKEITVTSRQLRKKVCGASRNFQQEAGLEYEV